MRYVVIQGGTTFLISLTEVEENRIRSKVEFHALLLIAQLVVKLIDDTSISSIYDAIIILLNN